ncbi:hypothetical protein LEP1GSC062_0762 [Leptospira alexanderi serovar Manhao 3 str. L 60]|uniref:Uncharacterized protein n=1 Tax=Leptospira alexanderi serovar Manhao 3 str. L 60 TaxID=1049759 RepID=V6I8Y5_9LEPT|nr:hypothetical protein LEP1GSC062_0762 [Leptospira alexanderi serovar Manhao 3 str. L 60]
MKSDTFHDSLYTFPSTASSIRMDELPSDTACARASSRMMSNTSSA